MYDHIGIKVGNLDASVRFYTAALSPLGYVLCSRDENGAGLAPRANRRCGSTSIREASAAPTSRSGLASTRRSGNFTPTASKPEDAIMAEQVCEAITARPISLLS
jgi:catechol 2,3-dioxygenase-like lactoylglutathione lyase family enzyme